MLLYLDYVPYGSKKDMSRYRYLLSCFIMLIGVLQTSKCYAVASPDDTIIPYVGFNMLYDSNFLRLSDNVDPILVTGKSNKDDFIKQVSAGFDMDWTISRQHIIIRANVNQNWFQNFTSLDYTGWDTQAQWNWQIGNNLDGEIGYANLQTLGSFAQLGELIDNLRNYQRFFASAGYLFHPNGKIKFGVFRTESQFDDVSRQISNNTEDNAELNLQYLSPTGTILGLRILATDGRYPQRQLTAGSTQDNAYTRMNYALTWDWHASSKTHIDGLLGYTQQWYEHFSARDFDDIIAQLNLRWQATDKTLLELSARRLIDQANNFFSSFLLTEGVWLNLTWQTTPKITLAIPVSYQQQQYLGNTGNNLVNFEQQKDDVGNIGLNLMYHPLESINIELLLNYEKRDSNNPRRSYETQSAGLNLQAFF